ncbi:Ammonium transporter, partial [hydrothermal vent metagenome]
VLFKGIDLTIGLRVSDEDEVRGLDLSTHGEAAYHNS